MHYHSFASSVFFILLLQLSSYQQQQQQVLAQQPSSLSNSDEAALRDIQSHIRDLPGTDFFSTWDFTADPCATFSGVVCSLDDRDEGGGSPAMRVSALTLGTGLEGSFGLTGTLPSSISQLTALTELVIYPGRISGPIPPEIGARLCRLRLVSISHNLVSGSIPSTLAGLPDLHTLDLSNNHLEGPIPSPLLSSSPSLKVLILASNGGLSGQLPREVSFTQLLHLDLRQNAFTGHLPPLPSTLRYLSISANSMSGLLNDALRSPPPDLAFLDLSMNGFTGTIPPAIFASPNLTTILLDRNRLSGPLTIPPLPQSSAWAVVDVSHNALAGEVPAALAAAEALYLNSNRFTGPVPEELSRSVFSGSTTTFYAQHNFLTEFSSPPLPLPDSVALCLAYNCMLPPPSANSGCPSSSGTQISRPTYQCPNATTGGSGRRLR